MRITEAAERQRIVGEYESQLRMLQHELDQVREDTAYTLAVMQQEMERWEESGKRQRQPAVHRARHALESIICAP